MKVGISDLGKKFSLSSTLLTSLITNTYVVFGAVLYGISFILWLYVLSKVKVSYAYPFISLSYALVAVLGFFLLDEKISFDAWMGICLVVVGVVLIGMNIGGT
ncbi:MAG: membrane protein containing DUF6, transmembrane [Candidatus Syntrophoarchaeum caldarius]|uniref:Membrane protein containing DUF6, transmembrane n=1 Tax=Candidatus Syntropharchaeum caldarium TaxID=1838285 RepID=A0A1F2P8H7_9EURY|nr:MAG: membrane protein containing DUF6, transmembrane [Candidatus Syntrophoarchaeum caldarius]